MNEDAEFLATSGQYADVLRRRKDVVAIGAAASLILALLTLMLSGGGPSLRTAEATIEVRPITENIFASNTRVRDLVSMATEVEVMQSSNVAARVIRRLGLETSAEDLLTNLRVENPNDTLVLRIEYDSGKGDVARTRAQAFAEAYLSYRTDSVNETITRAIDQIKSQSDAVTKELAELTQRQNEGGTALEASNLQIQVNNLNQQLGDLQGQIAAFSGIFVDPGSIVTNARLTETSTAPGWVTAAGMLGIGLVVAVGAAVVVDRLDERPRDETEVIVAVPAPVYGVQFVDIGDDSESDLGVRAAKARRTLGEYRRLRLRLESGTTGGIRHVLVATPVDDNAAGQVATNLARVVLQGRETACLVWNEDIRRGALDDLGAKLTGSLDDVIDGGRALDDVLAEVPGHPGLALVGLSVGQTGAMTAQQLRSIYRALLDRFDIVITVAPSASPADTTELATYADGTIVAVDAQRATRVALHRQVTSLLAVDAEVVAAFVTRPRPWW